MQKIRYFFYFLAILSLSSCFLTNNVLTDQNINKKLETETNEVKIATIVEKYSRSKKWFYGTIEIYNKTELTYEFNFNQVIRTKNLYIKPDWNIFPVSYANVAFDVNPHSIKKWTVAWTATIDKIDLNDILIISDTKMILKNDFRPVTPIDNIDTSRRFLKYDSIKK